MYAVKNKSLGVARRGRRGMGAPASYITASGARISYDTSAPPPGITGSSAYLQPAVQPGASAFADGTYILNSIGQVWVVMGGLRYGISSPAVGDALGGGYKNAITVTDAQFNAIPAGGGYNLQGNTIIVKDTNGNVISVEPIPTATPAASVAANSGLYWDGTQWLNANGVPASSIPTTGTPYVITSPVAATTTVSSGLSSLTSLLPTWWPYAAIAGVGWWMFSGRKGRR
jgi:hypothetical protein